MPRATNRCGVWWEAEATQLECLPFLQLPRDPQDHVANTLWLRTKRLPGKMPDGTEFGLRMFSLHSVTQVWRVPARTRTAPWPRSKVVAGLRPIYDQIGVRGSGRRGKQKWQQSPCLAQCMPAVLSSRLTPKWPSSGESRRQFSANLRIDSAASAARQPRHHQLSYTDTYPAKGNWHTGGILLLAKLQSARSENRNRFLLSLVVASGCRKELHSKALILSPGHFYQTVC